MKKKAAKAAKKKGGRPPYIPSEEHRTKLRLLVIIGVPIETIAEILGISKPTVYLHYKKDIETAAQEANAQVAANLFRQTKTNPAAAIFWMKTKCGWRERDSLENSENGPLRIELVRGEDRPSVKDKVTELKRNGTSGG